MSGICPSIQHVVVLLLTEVQCFEHGNAVQIRNRLMLYFLPGTATSIHQYLILVLFPDPQCGTHTANGGSGEYITKYLNTLGFEGNNLIGSLVTIILYVFLTTST